MSSDTSKLLTTADVAERLGVSPSYLNKLRLYGGGPAFIKLGTRVTYDPADLAEWLDARRQRSTSETKPEARP